MTQTLQNSLKTVLDLQRKWRAENTQSMQERGELIRNEIPSLLKQLSEQNGMEVEGRDGTGRKTHVPWVRLYDPRFSPSATEGWYVVFLFAADGSAVFISLNQGTTKFTNGSFVPIDPELLRERVNDARTKLDDRKINLDGLLQSVDLRDPGDKGPSYELGNAYAIRYAADAIPPDATILSDTSRLLDLLKIVYASAVPSTETGDVAYLLAWNPGNWPWNNLPGLAMQYRSGEEIAAQDADTTWNVANKAVKPGDRLFLIRLGKEPKGIMGSGYSVSAPYKGPHYSESGKTATYVKLKWDVLLDPERDKVLPLVELRQSIPEVNWTTNNSGIVISPNARSRLEQMWKSHLSGSTPMVYTMDDALADVFLERDFFMEICDLARRRKNIVLQGPPGVGKTFVAKRLAYALLGAKDNSRLEWVQFHQSYSYEDFVLGFRPNGTGFELKPGIFYRFCQKASAENSTHVFVIDEINRGNLTLSPRGSGLELNAGIIRPDTQLSRQFRPFDTPGQRFPASEGRSTDNATTPLQSSI